MLVEVLKEDIRKMVMRDDDLIYALAKANKSVAKPKGMRIGSIQRWVKINDESLTKAKNLTLIKSHFNLPDDMVLTEQKEVEAV